MRVVIIRATVKVERVADVDAAARRMFSAIEEAQEEYDRVIGRFPVERAGRSPLPCPS